MNQSFQKNNLYKVDRNRTLLSDSTFFHLIVQYPELSPESKNHDKCSIQYMCIYHKPIGYRFREDKILMPFPVLTTYVTIAIVNHVLSAVDAAWTAASYNRNLHASVRMQQVPTYRGYALIPVARVEYSF